jgi:hypothetical protein
MLEEGTYDAHRYELPTLTRAWSAILPIGRTSSFKTTAPVQAALP